MSAPDPLTEASVDPGGSIEVAQGMGFIGAFLGLLVILIIALVLALKFIERKIHKKGTGSTRTKTEVPLT